MKQRSMCMAAALLMTVACQRSGSTPHGHDHGNDHGHDHGASEEEVEPIAITRWTDDYELFVEFPPPQPKKPVRYHAHVTRLRDFAAVKTGRFSVRFERAGTKVAETSIDRVARPGIFTPEGKAPAQGSYELVMQYEEGGTVALFRCGALAVPAKPPPETAGGGSIAFLKEAQWAIPFGTALASKRAMSRELELPATIEPASSEQLTMAAPISGRFFHRESAALASGQAVQKGDTLGTLAPNAEGEDLGRLELAAEQSRIEGQRVQREIARVRPLVERGLLPEKRRIDLENELLQREAARKSAEQRLGRVLAPAGRGGLPLRAAVSGVIAEVVAPNGEPVASGAPLLRLRGSGELWARARFVSRGSADMAGAVPAAVRSLDSTRLSLAEGARFLSAEPVVDATTGIATWVAALPVPDGSGAGGDAGEATARAPNVGASVVLIVRAGERRETLAVPASAVVEINTVPYVFVQTGGEEFEKRRADVGFRDGEYVEIRSGVQEGEHVVTRGGFDVHLATLAGLVESHRH
ncbi:MAG TPA: hypothetical protein VI072_35195 [Polyangiaceae bacterium]